MKKDTDTGTKKIEKEILDYLGMGTDALRFDYKKNSGKITLNLVTINPRHNQSFLFHSEIGIDKTEALQKMVTYVKKVREKENTYTVQWMARNDKELHTSYFRAKNMYEALDKLYYGRDTNLITVYSVNLNPIS